MLFERSFVVADDLNELRLAGDGANAERVMHLRGYLKGLHRGQGLGFRIFSTVLDKRVLSSLFAKVVAGATSTCTCNTVMLLLVEFGQVGDAEDLAVCNPMTEGERHMLWAALGDVLAGGGANTSCAYMYEQLAEPMFVLH